MKLREFERLLRYFRRSGSLRFALNSRDNLPIRLTTFNWNGRAVYFRTGTREPEMIYNILVRGREYSLPGGLNPKTVLDIGANVGIASVYMADRWPDASIFSFEPLETNYEILKLNSDGTAIHPYNVGLGAANETRTLYLYHDGENTTNYGDLTMYEEEGRVPEKEFTVNVRKTDEMLEELNINSVDVLKIDTEGAEWDIITTIPVPIISDTAWIIGELHEYKDFELLSYLSRWFDVRYVKHEYAGAAMFTARNKKARHLIE